MGKQKFGTNCGNRQTFSQMLAGLEKDAARKPSATAFQNKLAGAQDAQKSKDKAVEKAKECFAPFLKNNHNAEGRVVRAFYEIAECYLENGGALSVDALRQKFTRAMPHQSNITEGRKLVSISFTAQKEVRFVLDLTEQASPIFLFAGWQDDAQKFFNKFDRSVSIQASQNGKAALFQPLKDYLSELAKEKGKN
ncbi:MAG: hypothetical protein WCT52_02625 [Candidatus Micrarchaeia archaeon]